MQSQSKVVQQIQDVVEFFEPRIKTRPEVAIILGSGLGGFANHIEDAEEISYHDIPHFQNPSVEGHEGKMIFGKVRGVPVAVLQGRWHFYEGHSMNSIVIPTRALAALGAHTILLTNAAGGVNLDFKGGDLMTIVDHINMMGDNPLTGRDSVMFGPRFPDMSEPYSHDCIRAIEEAGARLKMPLKRGTYIGLRGPTYETPAEVKMLRILGGDAVGMSTVPEAIAARHLGMRVAGISCITNMAAGIEQKTLTHDEVQEVAALSMNQLARLMIEAMPELARKDGPSTAQETRDKFQR
ncbi:MAG: purine-nucleoside phosphorylase [Bdellovibrionota bacterium]